jgi:hypothetical protein
VSLAKSRPAKRQRKPTQPFQKGVNSAPLTLPPTARHPVRSPEPPKRGRTRTPIRSPLFEPEASQLATDAQAAAILRENDDDDEEELAAAADDEGDKKVRWTLEAATAIEPVVELHSHVRWRAC